MRQQKTAARRGRPDGRKIFPIVCLFPWIAGFAIFTLYPIVQSLKYSFSQVSFRPDGNVQTQFVGLANYIKVLIQDTYFKIASITYVQQVFGMVPIMVVFSLLTALFLNTKIRFRRVFRAIYFLPVILMQGVLYDILRNLDVMRVSGLEDFFVFSFITEKLPGVFSAPVMYVMNQFVVIIWMSGVQILICLAGLGRIDSNLYEAACVDGASSWQSFWKITLPLIKNFIVLCGIYSVVDLSTSPLNPIIVIIKDVMFNYAYGFGFSAAATWVYFLMIVLFVLAAAFICSGCRIGSPEKRNRRRKQRRARG